MVAISSRHNRSKGARGPEEWKPPDDELRCQYATDWAEIKGRWELTMTEPEADAVAEMLDTCEEAAEAREQRVQDGRGRCLGYPKTTVSTARDGDGDRMVCER